MRANGEIELKEQFVGVHLFSEPRPAVLRPNLAELGGPERHEHRRTGVREGSVEWACRAIEAGARIPAARELILPEAVHPERRRVADGEVLPAPDELRSQIQTLINRAAQRAIAERRVEADQ